MVQTPSLPAGEQFEQAFNVITKVREELNLLRLPNPPPTGCLCTGTKVSQFCPIHNQGNISASSRRLGVSEPTMKTSYFSFGFSHVHSVNGFTYDKDVLVKITAEDPRQVMFDTFGPKWAMQYDEPPEPQYYPLGIKELHV